MNGEVKRLPNMPELIFISYFKPRLAPEYYQRAKTAFDLIGKYLPVAFATQIYLATRYGKVEEVLSSYEWLVGQVDDLLKKPSRAKCADLMRRFTAAVYRSVIVGRGKARLEDMVRRASVPKVFTQMSSNRKPASQKLQMLRLVYSGRSLRFKRGN